jgi:hypothetical protein
VAALGIFQLIVDIAVALLDILDSNQATVFQLSFIAFQEAQSKITISQSVEFEGQSTSQLQGQVSPLGIQKLRIASWLVHTLVTVAELQAGSVVVLHTVIVAAAPSSPSTQGSHLAHCGIVKFNTAALDVQELVTLALLHGVPVVVLHTVIVAAAPSSQSCQGVHGSPLSSSLLANLASSETESKIRILSLTDTSDFTSNSLIDFTGITIT